MGLVYKNRQLAVECIDCGFRGPGVSEEIDIAKRDEAAIQLWLALPRPSPIDWTPEMRIDRIMHGVMPL